MPIGTDFEQFCAARELIFSALLNVALEYAWIKNAVLEQEKLELKETNKPQAPVEPEILTERHPYEVQDLFQAVEDEMEDMMQEMKGRIQSR